MITKFLLPHDYHVQMLRQRSLEACQFWHSLQSAQAFLLRFCQRDGERLGIAFLSEFAQIWLILRNDPPNVQR
jgi:hypothetical protein